MRIDAEERKKSIMVTSEIRFKTQNTKVKFTKIEQPGTSAFL